MSYLDLRGWLVLTGFLLWDRKNGVRSDGTSIEINAFFSLVQPVLRKISPLSGNKKIGCTVCRYNRFVSVILFEDYS